MATGTDKTQDNTEASRMISDQVNSAFGLELDDKAASALRAGVARGIPIARRWMERKVTEHGPGFFERFGKDKGQNYANAAATALGYAFSMLPQLFSTFGIVKKAVNSWRSLENDHKDIPVASKSNNYVLAERYSALRKEIGSNVNQWGVSLIDAAPQIYLTYNDQQERTIGGPILGRIRKEWESRQRSPYNYQSEQDFFEQRLQAYGEHPGRLTEEEQQSLQGYGKFKERTKGISKMIEDFGTFGVPILSSVVQKLIGKKAHESQRKTLYDYIHDIEEATCGQRDGREVRFMNTRMPLDQAIAGLLTEAYRRQYNTKEELPPRQLKEASKLIAEAIIEDKLPARALIELVGQNKIVLGKQGDIASPDQVQEAIDAALTRYAKDKLLEPKTFFKDTGVSAEDVKSVLVDTHKHDKEMFNVLATLFPRKVVADAVGISTGEVRKAAKEGMRMQAEQIVDLFKQVASMNEQELKAIGVSDAELEGLKVAANRARRTGASGVIEALSEEKENEGGLKQTLAKVVAKEGASLWQDRIHAERGPQELAERDRARFAGRGRPMPPGMGEDRFEQPPQAEQDRARFRQRAMRPDDDYPEEDMLARMQAEQDRARFTERTKRPPSRPGTRDVG